MKRIALVFFLFLIFFVTGCNNKVNENVEEIIGMIETIPSFEEITLEDEELIMQIEHKYSCLLEEEKELVTNYQVFFNAKLKIQELNDYLKATVAEIETMITELPKANKISINHKQMLDSIATLLEGLSETEKEYVDGIDKYYEARAKYEELVKQKENEALAKELVSEINKLPSEISIKLSDEEKIKNIREKYEALDADVKSLIENINILENLEKILVILKKYNTFDIEDVLSCVSDIASPEKEDILTTSSEGYTIDWSSSNTNVYTIVDQGDKVVGKVNKIFQSHQYQYITITGQVVFANGDNITLTKEIKIAPIKFEKLPSTPVATYFQTGALSSYTNYSDRYKTEGTLFSEKAKDVLDIVYYAFAYILENGTLYLSDTKTIDEIRKLRENDTRVVLCISGVSGEGSKTFKKLTDDSVKRKRFVSNIVKFLEEYNFDGVDIDWESSEGALVVAQNMNWLMEDLRAELNSKQAKGGTPYLLSAAIPSTSWGAGTDRFDFKTLNKYVDYINMMSYDLNNPDKTTHLSGAYTSSHDKGYGFSCEYGVNLFTSRGLDKEKIILGTAGYGKAYRVTEDTSSKEYPLLGCKATLTLLPDVPGSFASGTVFLNGINIIIQSGKYKQKTEYNSSGKIVGSYLYNEEEKIFITYDSKESIEAKYDYAASVEGMGIMCWAYTEDTSDNYVNAIYNKLN